MAEQGHRFSWLLHLTVKKGATHLNTAVTSQTSHQKCRRALVKIRQSRELYLLFFFPFLYFLIFKYGSMFWMLIAFKDYDAAKGIWASEWVGLKWFRSFLLDEPYFWTLIRNTLTISLSELIFYFPCPIIMALMLNEVRSKKLKSVYQSISYLPYFFSVVVICGLLVNLFSTDGIVNSMVAALGGKRIRFLTDKNWFVPIYILSDIWQGTGWGSIIYLAALSGIDPQLYEASLLDGASRWKQTLHISLPGIKSVISIQFLLSLGKILSVGYEKILLLYNGSNMEVADIISTYVYRRGLVSADFSYGTAVNIFQAVIGLLLIIVSNWAARKAEAASLW